MGHSDSNIVLLGSNVFQVLDFAAVSLLDSHQQIKLILLRYFRLNPDRWFRMAVWFLMFMVFAYTIATTVIVAAGCKPTDPSKTQCINNLALAQAILNIASDFLIIALPLPMIWKLHIPRGQKIALAFILGGGSL